ncbi:3-isopropylmalate dehydratase, small subunit [Desulforamulus reducens MI-1]|uniref:3-isopropylmalate dehydratase small subunit n=1 Tax=Desulforamulus reducens (strain ATCC BAA-1160 / DSM 100696 / MI-1) TaxID=349161 RepID=A4J183_DESRM|nr:3-isopropylmalate dehydratase small subunit [Desulforamulus reducens]ABO48836.1 3-isopropylmalate dehydratase, small subunit [Desulforamulus reducens MI-1]
MNQQGKVWKFGNDIDTDIIIAARYLNSSDPVELAKHCMEDGDPTFASKVSAGDVMLAGKNFGCGSSREHAPIAIKAAGVSCVVAKSYARIFYRNAFNIGLPIFECPEAVDEINEGDVITVDAASGAIVNQTSGKHYQAVPIPDFMRQIIDAGGLISYVKGRVKQDV